MSRVYAALLAGGTGERVGHHLPKQFIKIAGKMVIEHTLEVFEKNRNIDEVILVVNPAYRSLIEKTVRKNRYEKITKIVGGGLTRMESSAIGIGSITDDRASVLIHDAVRPFVSDRIIDDCVRALKRYDAVDVAIAPTDTIVKIDDKRRIIDIPSRWALMRGQTPQGFRVGVIRKAHEMASRDRFTNATDDCALVLRYGLADIYVIKGAEDNIKITYMTDVFLADKLFQLRSVPATHVMRLEEIKGKVVVVFGASRGIGRAIMQTAKKAGARAYGFSRHDGVDVSSITDVEKALRKVYGSEKRIDYVVNTAGIMHTGRIEDMAFEDIVSEIKVNFTGSINVLKQGIRYLKKTKGAILLFTSSSYTRGRAMYSVYSSTKAAVVNLVQAVAEELLPEGIRINAINPERTATPMRREHFGKEPEESLLRPEYVAAVSLKTLLSGITGQVIDIRKEDD